MAAAKGNDYAKRGQKCREAICRALARNAGSVDSGLDKLADKLVKFAMMDDPKDAKWAAELIIDRLDGKAVQAVETSGPDGGPIPVSRIELVAIQK